MKAIPDLREAMPTARAWVITASRDCVESILESEEDTSTGGNAKGLIRQGWPGKTSLQSQDVIPAFAAGAGLSPGALPYCAAAKKSVVPDHCILPVKPTCFSIIILPFLLQGQAPPMLIAKPATFHRVLFAKAWLSPV